MEEDDIRRMFEEMDPENKIDPSKIEDFIQEIKNLELNPPKDGDKIGDATFSILEKIQNEPDWRKRASLAAKLISLGLE